ncbi:protein translocase subunit SecF [Cohnella lubricantis]|uniref:Protein-export membrane protein SecF n=1 Tax=Cohnella lubricantis TaxID=2163172 RepID=A0A841TBY7_9BACL|nr:protein translocase subunit SecF [Cohnella lubricantis]MBB6677646.1 protein translocase subunit SecF [Cohnella lubricantis]MBP2116466.1 SecD/SecF fusion protein [Cohnella lubricantis]
MRYSFRNFDFVKASKGFFIFSIVLTLLGIASLSIFGLNYGIDFQSGSSVDITTSKHVDKTQAEDFFKGESLGEFTFTTGDDRFSVRFKDALDESQQLKLENDFKSKFDDKASFEINIVDVDIAKEQERNALYGMLIACIGIVIYVAIRFEWRFAVSSVIALAHDAFLVITMFSLFRLEVNLPFILAILTIIGYSINDTVVIFDRIRENLRFAKIKGPDDLKELVNTSVRQTLTRSINTVATVLFASLCLFAFGSISIKMFSLAMLFGLFFGAYSSIFIASPLWLMLRKRAKPKKAVKVQSAP